MRIEDVVLIVTFIVGFSLFAWYVLGDSPTIDQVILGMLFLNFGWTFYLFKAKQTFRRT